MSPLLRKYIANESETEPSTINDVDKNQSSPKTIYPSMNYNEIIRVIKKTYLLNAMSNCYSEFLQRVGWNCAVQ